MDPPWVGGRRDKMNGGRGRLQPGLAGTLEGAIGNGKTQLIFTRFCGCRGTYAEMVGGAEGACCWERPALPNTRVWPCCTLAPPAVPRAGSGGGLGVPLPSPM